MQKESRITNWVIAIGVAFVVVFFLIFIFTSHKKEAPATIEGPAPEVYEVNSTSDNGYYYVVWVNNGEESVYICHEEYRNGRYNSNTAMMTRATHLDGTGVTPEELGIELPKEEKSADGTASYKGGGMKFLHEYIEYQNGKIVDNGYWQINGDRLFNRYGGSHAYIPQDDDEIIEGTWDDVMRKAVTDKLDDNKTTGWVSPDGTFYGCDTEEHDAVAHYVLGCSDIELEERGYCKIYENPTYLRRSRPDTPEYAYYCKFLTDKQAEVLAKKGVQI